LGGKLAPEEISINPALEGYNTYPCIIPGPDGFLKSGTDTKPCSVCFMLLAHSDFKPTA